MPHSIPDLTRTFRTKIDECPDCGCWRFVVTDRYGYGQYKHNGRNLIAHRFAYERLVGPIPDDMTIDHLSCTLRCCVNPAHMELVSRTENSIRANARRHHGDSLGSCENCLAWSPSGDHPKFGTQKLTEEQITLILSADLSRRGSMRALAKELGCSHTYISGLRSGKLPNPYRKSDTTPQGEPS